MIDKLLQFLYGSLFFITPLIFAPTTSELFEFNKMLFIYVATILIVFLWLLKMILAKKIIFKRTPLDIPIFLFALSQILSSFFSIDRHVSFFGYYGRFNGGLLSTISFILLYYGFIANSVNSEFIMKTSLFSSLAVIVYALPGKLGHDLTCFLVSGGKIFNNSCWSKEVNIFDPADRAFSTLGQPNWLGAYLAINFFIGVYYLYQRLNIKDQNYISKIKNMILPSLYLVLNFSFVLFSRSRSALAAVGVGLILFSIYYFLFIKKDYKKIIITLLIITVIPVLLFKTGIERVDNLIKLPITKFQSSNKPPITNNQSQVLPSGVTESLDIRKIVWKGAVDLGLKYPLFGTGVETFAYSYNFVRPKEHNLTSEWDFIYNKAHNEFLNYLATTGFTGMIAYLLMIGTVIYFFTSKIRNQKSNITIYPLLLVAYLTILITNFFGFSTTTINLFFYLIPAIFVSLQGGNEVSNKVISFKKLNNLQYFFILLFLVSTIYLLYSSFAYWFADTQYAKGINYLKPQISDYQKAAMYFEKALKVRSESIYEDRFSSSLSYLAAIAAYQKQSDVAKQLLYVSDYYNKKSLRSSPQNIFYWKTRAKDQYLFYQVTLDVNDLNEGVNALNVGQKLAPTDPKIPYSLAVYYSLLYDAEKNQTQKITWQKKSLTEIDEALVLKKDFQDSINLKKELLKKYNLL